MHVFVPKDSVVTINQARDYAPLQHSFVGLIWPLYLNDLE